MWKSEFRVQGSRSRVQGLGFRVQGLGFRVQGRGLGVYFFEDSLFQLKLEAPAPGVRARPISVGTPERSKTLQLLRTFSQLCEFVPGFPLDGLRGLKVRRNPRDFDISEFQLIWDVLYPCIRDLFFERHWLSCVGGARARARHQQYI